MKRLLAVLFAAFTLLGCRSNGEATDPFFGRATIDPPRTGSVLGQSEPYYQPSNSASAQATAPLRPVNGPPPSLAAPTPVANPRSYPPSNAPYVSPAANPLPAANPGAGYQYQNYNNRSVPADPTGWHGATTACPPACPPAWPAVNCAPAYRCVPTCTCPPGTVPVAAQPVCNAAPAAVQTPTYGYQPTPADGSAARLASRPDANRGGALPPHYGAASAPSAYGSNPGQPLDIGDLPEHHDRSTSTQPPPSGAAVRPVTATIESPGASRVVQAVANVPVAGGDGSSAAARQTNYAQEPEFQSLRGRLEYSQIDRAWKLRLDPSEGVATETVLIANPTVLVGYERGDRIQSRGRLSLPDSAAQGSAPRYEVVDIQRVGA